MERDDDNRNNQQGNFSITNNRFNNDNEDNNMANETEKDINKKADEFITGIYEIVDEAKNSVMQVQKLRNEVDKLIKSIDFDALSVKVKKAVDENLQHPDFSKLKKDSATTQSALVDLDKMIKSTLKELKEKSIEVKNIADDINKKQNNKMITVLCGLGISFLIVNFFVSKYYADEIKKSFEASPLQEIKLMSNYIELPNHQQDFMRYKICIAPYHKTWTPSLKTLLPQDLLTQPIVEIFYNT